MPNRSNFKHRIVARQAEAEERLVQRAERSDEEQLAKLQDEGHGNSKEAKGLR